MGRALRRALAEPALPERYRQPAGWPAPMREEWGKDQGLAAAERHREALLNGFCRVRQVLDDFAPDLVVIWGDDQYENFKEDIIPPSAFSLTNRWGRRGRNIAAPMSGTSHLIRPSPIAAM
jgi:hypothetical protein